MQVSFLMHSFGLFWVKYKIIVYTSFRKPVFGEWQFHTLKCSHAYSFLVKLYLCLKFTVEDCFLVNTQPGTCIGSSEVKLINRHLLPVTYLIAPQW